MSLFDEIQARLRASQPAAPQGSAQQAALATFQAKTGKATVPGGPAASNVGEQVAQGAVAAQGAQQQAQISAGADALAQQRAAAVEQASQAQKDLAAQDKAFQVGQQAQAANAAGQRQTTGQLAAIQGASREDLTTTKLSAGFKTAVSQLASERKTTADDIFETFRQGTQDLAFRRDSLDLELTAQKMALADKQYVDQLKQVGTLQRLDNDLNFKQESTSLAMGANWDAMQKANGFVVDMNANSRAFEEQLAAMSGPAAMAIMMQDMSAANSQQIGKGALDIGIDVGKYEYNKPAAEIDTSPDLEDGSVGDLRASERY